MTMPQDEWTPGTYIIYELVAILIMQPGALPPLDERWRPPDRLEGTHRAIDASRQIALGILKESA